MNYRPEIDGLRALAVVSVILYHAGVPGLPGGFTGVDIFFVISGYLITSILLRDLEKRNFSVLHFYQRRARRILPALILVVAVSIIPAWLLMFPADFQEFGRSVMATSLSFSNILFWRESGYFATENDLKPLLHTWSLAVEEQYYLLFPLGLLVLWRLGFRKRPILYVFLILVSLGFVFADWASTRYISASYYLLPSRAWEILGGSVIAAILYSATPPQGAFAEIGAMLGLGLIISGIILIDETYAWPGRWALVPVIGTMLFVFCARSTTTVGRIFAWSPLVGIGLISYSAYLWHQPLFAFTRIAIPTGELSSFVTTLLIGATFGLAWLSWKFVEQPFRNTVSFPGNLIGRLALGGTLAMLAVGTGVSAGDGWPRRFTPEVQRLIATAEENGRGRNGCHPHEHMPDNGCRFDDGHGDAPRVLLWGDSHAMALSEALAEKFSERGIVLETLTSSGCPPILDLTRKDRNCLEVNSASLNYIASNNSPKIVLLHGYWPAYVHGSSLLDSNVGTTKPNPFMILNGKGQQVVSDQAVSSRLEATVLAILKSNKVVVVIGGVPEAGLRLSRYMARRAILGLSTAVSGRQSIAAARSSSSRAVFERLKAEGQIDYVDPADLLCDSATDVCTLHEGQVPFYRDGNHLSQAGAKRVAEYIDLMIAPVTYKLIQLSKG